MTEETLHQKTVKGAAWSFADNFLSLGISFIVGIILARLLSPEEYGLIGIITIFVNVFNSIVDSGFSNALIRKNDASDTDYNTVFWSNLFVSSIMCLALFLCSEPIAIFFERPELKALTQVMSIIVIINAFAIVQRTLLVKKIDFKTQTKVSLIASITSGVIGVGMAMMGFGVWSLVGQQISRQLFNTVFLWILNKWRPQKLFSWLSFKELFGFGWKLLVSSLINTTWNELYQVVIGKCYNSSTLGLYTRAQQFASLFSSNITTVVQRVSYPALSSIKEDNIHLKAAYQRVIKVTMLVTFTLMLGLAGVADKFVYVLVGEKWMECVPMLQILCFQMMLFPLHAINLNMLQVQGRSDLFLKLEIIKKAAAIVPLLLGVFVGIYWMLIGSVVISFFSYYLNAYYSGPFLNYSIKEQVKDILPSLAIALFMSGGIYCLGFINISVFLLLPLQIVTGGSIIIFFCEIFKLPEFLEVKEVIKKGINKKKWM